MKRDEFFLEWSFTNVSMIRENLIIYLYYISYYISGFNNILFRISLNAINNFYEFEIKFNNTLD